MQTERIKEERVLIRIKKVDSMGRTAEVRKAMEKNDPPPVKIADDDLFIRDTVAEVCVDYPKSMYRLALRGGKPAGDEANPSYPMPFDLAQQLGLTEFGFKVIGKSRDSAGNVVIKLPYETKKVGVVREDLTVDVAAARKEEADLRRLGWVDHPSKIKGLPVPLAEQPFDPVPMPDAPGNQTQAATIKEAVGLNTAAQQATAAPETAPLNGSGYSKQSNPESKRGGARVGAGRKRKVAVTG